MRSFRRDREGDLSGKRSGLVLLCQSVQRRVPLVILFSEVVRTICGNFAEPLGILRVDALWSSEGQASYQTSCSNWLLYQICELSRYSLEFLRLHFYCFLVISNIGGWSLGELVRAGLTYRLVTHSAPSYILLGTTAVADVLVDMSDIIFLRWASNIIYLLELVMNFCEFPVGAIQSWGILFVAHHVLLKLHVIGCKQFPDWK